MSGGWIGNFLFLFRFLYVSSVGQSHSKRLKAVNLYVIADLLKNFKRVW
jgi:hypothetical protein